MIICLDQRNSSGCGATNKDNALHCHQCGKPLRFALVLQNPGTLVGSYEIVNVIGYGGFGAVYHAKNTATGQEFALKETFDPSSTRAFKGEFAKLHHLEHDHLPKYYDMFETQGNGYLVMELIPGQSLLEVLERRQEAPLVESQVLGYAVQLCDALTYLHTQNPTIIHRDIKPANIRLTPDGLVKLVDFGLLKQGTDTTGSSRLGLTPAYAPIEQWGGTGMHTTLQTDIYSLGATLYHLITGKSPFPVHDRLAVSPDPLPSPKHLNPRVSTHLSDAIMCALEIQPIHRFPDASSFKNALIDVNVPAVHTTIPQQGQQQTVQVITPNVAPMPIPPTSIPTQPVAPQTHKSKFAFAWWQVFAIAVVLLLGIGLWISNGGQSEETSNSSQPGAVGIVDDATDTPVTPPTNTPVTPPTNTPITPPTNTPVSPPTNTPVSPPTNTPVPPPTNTPVPPPTNTPVPPALNTGTNSETGQEMPLTLYFADSSGSTLVPIQRQTRVVGMRVATTAMQELIAGPSGTLTRLVPADTSILDIQRDGDTVMVNLNRHPGSDLSFCAIALTLSEFEGVSYVEILINGQMIGLGGNNQPISRASCFQYTNSIIDEPDPGEVMPLTLYFADSSGSRLVSIQRQTRVVGMRVATTAMQELIAGPSDTLTRLVPADTSILDIQREGDTVMVNLNRHPGSDLSFCAIALTLSEFDGVSYVDIRINGQTVGLGGYNQPISRASCFQ